MRFHELVAALFFLPSGYHEISPLTRGGFCCFSDTPPSELLGCDGFVRLEEAPRLLYGFVDVWLRILPGIHGHLGVRREASDLHRNLVWVRRYVVGRYKQWRLHRTHEIA